METSKLSLAAVVVVELLMTSTFERRRAIRMRLGLSEMIVEMLARGVIGHNSHSSVAIDMPTTTDGVRLIVQRRLIYPFGTIERNIVVVVLTSLKESMSVQLKQIVTLRA